MPTVTDPSIRLLRALRTQIRTVTGLPEVAWLGVEFPKEGDPYPDEYLEEKFWRGDSALAELGSPTVLKRGPILYQIDLVTKSGKGPDAALVLADAISKAAQDLQFSVSGERARGHVTKTAIGPVLPEGSQGMRIPISIYLQLEF